jgi:tetratricopeptide (TPR) repeat protein
MAPSDRSGESLAAIEEAVYVLRTLTAEGRGNGYRPDLAACLLSLAGQLEALDRPDEALKATEEATTHYRQLAQTDPEGQRPALARCLLSLAAHLGALDRHEEALAATEEAAAHHRRLFQADPEAHRAALADCLHKLAVRLGERGRQGGLALLEEAVTHYRQLAVANQAYWQPLASVLSLLAIWWEAVGRDDDAASTIREAEAFYRKLAEADPDSYLPELGAHLYAHSWAPGAAAEPTAEALDALEEATDIYRRLADAHPGEFTADLAACLTTLAECYEQLMKRSDALTATEEAVYLYRHLAGIDPHTYLPALAAGLHTLADRLGMQTRLPPLREAVAICRQLANADPETYVPHLVTNLHSLASCLDELGRAGEAVRIRSEANAICASRDHEV